MSCFLNLGPAQYKATWNSQRWSASLLPLPMMFLDSVIKFCHQQDCLLLLSTWNTSALKWMMIMERYTIGCAGLFSTFQFQWCIPLLTRLDICTTLVKLLMCAVFIACHHFPSLIGLSGSRYTEQHCSGHIFGTTCTDTLFEVYNMVPIHCIDLKSHIDQVVSKYMDWNISQAILWQLVPAQRHIGRVIQFWNHYTCWNNSKCIKYGTSTVLHMLKHQLIQVLWVLVHELWQRSQPIQYR